MLRAFGRYTADDLDVDAAGYERLARTVATWRGALAAPGRW